MNLYTLLSLIDHCQGSSTVVFDQCNRKCECVNKRIVKCSRLRRDWSELNIEDRLRYIAAIKFLATDELYRPRYEALVKQYQESFDTDAQVTEPSISQFIPYNRYDQLHNGTFLLGTARRIK